MIRYAMALVCAAMFLVSVPSFAAEWFCTVSLELTKAKGMHSETWQSTSFVTAPSKADAEKDVVVAVRRALRRQYPKAEFAAVSSSCQPSTPAILVPAKPAVSEYKYQCRVKTKWHWGSRSGDADESLEIVAPSEALAMGYAIARVQERIRVLKFSDKERKNVTFSATDAKCT